MSDQFQGHSQKENSTWSANDDTNVNETLTPDTCYELQSEYEDTILATQYWVKGVSLVILGSFGLIGNIVTILVLWRIDSNRNFNKLLIMLSTTDSLLIIYFILEKAIAETFSQGEEPFWYVSQGTFAMHFNRQWRVIM